MLEKYGGEMKIVHICQYYNDGWGYQENLLPRYQKKLGHDVVVITSDRRSFYPKDKNKRIIGIGTFFDNEVRVERIPIKREFKSRFVVFKDLMNVLEKEKPEYIFHHGLTSPSLLTVVKYKKNSKNVFLAADNHADYFNSGKLWIWRLIYYRIYWKHKISKNINDIDIFFSMTPNCMIFGEKQLNIPSAKHELLYLGSDVDNNHFDLGWREQIRKHYGIKDNDIIIVTAGKTDKRKKVDKIIRSLKEINENNLKFIIVGSIEKDYEKELDNLIGDDKRIIKVGWVDYNELFKYFSAADVALFPGGQSVLWQQTISCELPTIFRYWPDADYLLSNENGIFLFSDSQKELTQYLRILLHNPELREKMKKGAIKERDEILSYEMIAKQSLKQYKIEEGKIHE
jgi:glycosyltransferase involved in cell wall biosynthesis